MVEDCLGVFFVCGGVVVGVVGYVDYIGYG